MPGMHVMPGMPEMRGTIVMPINHRMTGMRAILGMTGMSAMPGMPGCMECLECQE